MDRADLGIIFAFYTLSGYLMTRVLHERNGFSIRGTAAFALNRVLRLWPAYLAIMTLALVALHFWPLQGFFFLIRTPASAADIITNAIIHRTSELRFRTVAASVETAGDLVVVVDRDMLLSVVCALLCQISGAALGICWPW